MFMPPNAQVKPGWHSRVEDRVSMGCTDHMSLELILVQHQNVEVVVVYLAIGVCGPLKNDAVVFES